MGEVEVNRSPTECPLCYENYTHEGSSQPRMIIPCGHTVCFQCITRLASQPAMVCPICRKKCPSRLFNEAGFPINYLAITLLENQKKPEGRLVSEDGGSRCSSNSDVRSPKMARSKSMKQDGSKNKTNECSECKRVTGKLCYCFHCASPVCADCKTQHTEGVVKDVEKQANTLQDQKRVIVKKIEALQRMLSTLDDNYHETENDIDDNFTIIQHEVTEAKSRLVDNLTQKYNKEKTRLQTHCESLTDALEKAGSSDLPEAIDKNVQDITGNEIALLCEQAMDLLVNSRNLRGASKAVKMKHCSFTFAHGEKLATVRTLMQKFGNIKVHSRLPNPEQWDPDDDDNSEGANIASNSGSIEDILTDDSNASTSRHRRRSSTIPGKIGGESGDSGSDREEAGFNRPFDRYSQRSASVYLSSGTPGRTRNPPTSSYVSGTTGASSKTTGGGVKSKVRNKLVKQQQSEDRTITSSSKFLRSASLNYLDAASDDGLSDTSRKNSVSGTSDKIAQPSPPTHVYATLREKYESIRGPVSSLIYRDNSKGHVLDVVARYRSTGFVVADNNEYQIRAFNSNYHLSAHFSFKLSDDDVPFISGIATTSDKIFLLVDSKNKYVRVFDRKGHFLRDIGKTLFQRPKDVCTDDVEIFVTDSGASCVQVFDMQGTHLRTLGGPGSADGEFLWPAGMKMTTEGKLVICDCNNNRIQYITKDGEHIQNISSIYGTYSALRPTCVDLDKENNVVVLFSESRRVKIYNKDQNVINDFRVEDELNSVAVTADGLIALVDGSKTGKCLIY